MGDKTGFRRVWQEDKRGKPLSSRVVSGKMSERGWFDLGFEGWGRVCQAEQVRKFVQERGGFCVNCGAVREAESRWAGGLQGCRGRQKYIWELAGPWWPRAVKCLLRSSSCILQAHGCFSFFSSGQWWLNVLREKEEILNVEVKKEECNDVLKQRISTGASK